MLCPRCGRTFDAEARICAYDGALLTSLRPANDPHLQPGTMVGDYRIEALIGEGGMGEVYRALQPIIRRKVAIKVLKTASRDAIGRFIREARALHRIRHRAIVDVLTFGQTSDGRHYFVMEYLEGSSLDVVLKARGAMPVLEALEILREVASALDTAHARGFVHRDIKPGNVFLERVEDEPAPRVRLLDFGIARQLDRAGDLTGVTTEMHTSPGTLMGTPQYMAPECFGAGEIDLRKVDLYALGVLAYQMLTGALPFEARSFGDLVAQIMLVAPPPPSQRSPGLSGAFDEPLLRALSREPGERAEKAAELVEALAAAARVAGDSGLEGAGGRPGGVTAGTRTDTLAPGAPTLTFADSALPTGLATLDAIALEREANAPDSERSREQLARRGPLEEGSAPRGDRPPAQGERPATQRERPATEGERPAVQGDRPATQGERPATEGERPATQGERPGGQGERPATQGERPATEGERPAVQGERPGTEGERPATQGALARDSWRGSRSITMAGVAAGLLLVAWLGVNRWMQPNAGRMPDSVAVTVFETEGRSDHGPTPGRGRMSPTGGESGRGNAPAATSTVGGAAGSTVAGTERSPGAGTAGIAAGSTAGSTAGSKVAGTQGSPGAGTQGSPVAGTQGSPVAGTVREHPADNSGPAAIPAKNGDPPSQRSNVKAGAAPVADRQPDRQAKAKPAGPTQVGRIMVGERLPRVAGLMLDGSSALSLDMVLKRPGTNSALVQLWASWCAPCRDELNQLKAGRARLEAAGVQILLINALEEAATVEDAVHRLGLEPLPLILDSNGVIVEKLGLSTADRGALTLPLSVVTDGTGVVRLIMTRGGKGYVDRILQAR